MEKREKEIKNKRWREKLRGKTERKKKEYKEMKLL